MTHAARALLLVALVACGPRHRDGAKGLDWDRAGVDWTRPPAPGAEPPWSPPVPTTFALRNGVQVVLIESHRLPLVSVRLINLRAGAREDGAELGLAALTVDVIAEAAGTLTSKTLPETVEQLGAHLDTAIAEDASTLWLDTLATTLDAGVGLLADVVQRPRFDAADVVRLREDAVEELRLRPQEPRKVAALVFDRVVLGGHPYGAPPAGRVDTVSALTGEDLRRFWDEHYAPAETTIVVAGDVDRTTLEPILARRFGGWQHPAPRAAVAPALAAPAAPTLALVDRPGAQQSVVMIGRRGVAAGEPGYFAAEVVNTAVGGSFASRLNARIREELGYTYGIYASFWRGQWTGTWATSTSLETRVTVPGIREALAILDAARAAPLPAAELAKTQQLLTRALPQSFETNAGTAGELTALVVTRQPLDWYQHWADGIRAVTAAQARDAAAAHWTDLSIVVVGDAAAIGDGLATLGLPIVRLDAEGNPI